MASKLLAAHAFVARTTSDDSGTCRQLQFPSLNSSVSSRHEHSGNTLSCSRSSPSSLLLQLHRLGYEGKDGRLRDGYYTQASSLLDIVDSSSLHKGRKKRINLGIMTEGLLSIRSRKDWRFQSKLGDRIGHGLGWNTSIRDLQRLACVVHSNRTVCGRYGEGSGNVCWCILVNFLRRGFSMAANGEKERERERQRALFSLCAQAMVASHMAQSPLLSFLWASWPSLVSELCGKRRSPNLQADGTRDPGHAPVSYLSHWKVLLSGFILGTLITMRLTSSASLGALLDSCFWLCLLCSFVFLAACTIQAVFFALMFVARGGIMASCKSFNTVLQKNVCAVFSHLLFADVRTGPLWFNGCPKHRAQNRQFSLSSLWSRSSAKVENEGYRLGRANKGGLRQVYSQLRSILPKQVKL